MEIKPYLHKTQYYETDQMQIIHHSNYIRWFEEARTDFMEQLGLSYVEMERMGIIVPVLSVSAEYKAMVRYGDTVSIRIKVDSFNGVKLALSYEVCHAETNELHTIGTSLHCFLNGGGRPISLKRTAPEIYEMFQKVHQGTHSH